MDVTRKEKNNMLLKWLVVIKTITKKKSVVFLLDENGLSLCYYSLKKEKCFDFV